jgi:outer membrane protein OmpU
MKNVLFASTALVAFSGAAVADVALSGRAEMGIFGATGVDIQFFTDIDVTFTMTGETDNGLSFGASVDLDEGGAGAPAVANNADDGGIAIFVRGDFGTVTLGDTDGALDWALTEAGNVGNPGSIADDETSHAGYNGSYGDGAYDGQILRYDFSAGDFGVAISLEMDDADVQDVGYAIGLKYNLDLGGTAVALGIGYQSAQTVGTTIKGQAIAAGTDIDIFGVSATATLGGGFTAGVVYSDWDIGGTSADHIGVGVGYSNGPISLHANYGQFDVDGVGESDGFGIAAAYDLGGGAVVHFGYGDGSNFANVDNTSASIGLGLSF